MASTPSSSASTTHAPAMPHGPLVEVFPDVFVVSGGYRFGPRMWITRNMTVVRQRGELTIINSVRLTERGEAELAALGPVRHVLRIGAAHGLDDPYYVERYRPVLWAPPGTRHAGGLSTDRALVPGECPLDGAIVFPFAHGREAEAALVLPIDGGVLVTCDSYQNWTTFDGCSTIGALLLRAMGFGPTMVGGPWTKRMGPDVRVDFDALAALPFRHLVPGHGTVLRDTAKAGLAVAVERRFGPRR